MKKRIVSFVLIITMLVAFVPFSDLNFTVNAASSDRDSYKSTYGVSYEELFRKYPAFLNHNTANDYYQLMYDTYADVLNSYGNKETFWASYWYALNEGVFFSYKEFMATVGIGDTVYDECLDKVTLDYLDNVMGVESSLLNEVVKNVSKDYSNLKLTYDLLQESEKAALVQMLKSQNIGITYMFNHSPGN